MKKRLKSNMHAKFGACMTIWKIVSFIWPTILGCHEKDCLITKALNMLPGQITNQQTVFYETTSVASFVKQYIYTAISQWSSPHAA